jgi:putative peptidoglycan lipid II flippase
VLPNLSRTYQTSSREEFSALIDWGVRWVVLIGLPAAIALFVLAVPLISTLFQSQVFDARDVDMSSRSLMAYAFGLFPFLLVKVFAPGFYARQDTRTPVRIAVIAIIVNVAISMLLFKPLGHVGLALATTAMAGVNAGLLFLEIRRAEIYMPSAGWRMLLSKTLLASAVMGGALFWFAGSPGIWVTAGGWWKTGMLSLLVLGGAFVYFGTLFLLGMRVRDFRGRPPA